MWGGNPGEINYRGNQLSGKSIIGEINYRRNQLPGNQLPGNQLPGNQLPGKSITGEINYRGNQLPEKSITGQSITGEINYRAINYRGNQIPGNINYRGNQIPGNVRQPDSHLAVEPYPLSLSEAMSPHLAHPCDLHDPSNLAIALSYFSVGFAQSFLTTPLNIYLVNDLNAEPAIQNTINILCTLPWSFKLFYGFISDAFPIYGMHRKPYLCSGLAIYSTSYIFYATFACHSSITLALCLFIGNRIRFLLTHILPDLILRLGTMGLIQLDVMCDTMTVERSRFEQTKNQGQMQASCYSIRFGGTLIGSLLGAAVCNRSTWGWGLSFHQSALLNGFLPLLLILPHLQR